VTLVSAQRREIVEAARVDGGCLLGDVDAAAAPHGPMMRIGVSLYRPQDAAEALRGYAAAVPTLPRTVGWHAALKHDLPALPFVPAELVGARLLMLISMWLGDAAHPAGAELIERLGAVGQPCLTASTVLPFGAAVQKLLDQEFPDGCRPAGPVDTLIT
jgi:hypothetical protein